MDKISTLAKNFQKNASGEAQRINTDLQSGLKRLESDTATALASSRQSLLTALKDNEKAMSEAIQRQQKAILWASRWPLGLLIILALALTAYASWQGVKVREQAEVIAQSKETLASLPVGWQVVQFEGKSYLQTNEGQPRLRQHRTDKKTWFIELTE